MVEIKMVKVRVICWSHCNSEWCFYSYFDSVEDYKAHIKSKGFDQRYFKLDAD